MRGRRRRRAVLSAPRLPVEDLEELRPNPAISAELDLQTGETPLDRLPLSTAHFSGFLPPSLRPYVL
jgi:hypothetical protein